MHFFREFKDNSGREHGNEINDPIFFIAFSDLTVFNIRF